MCSVQGVPTTLVFAQFLHTLNIHERLLIKFQCLKDAKLPIPATILPQARERTMYEA